MKQKEDLNQIITTVHTSDYIITVEKKSKYNFNLIGNKIILKNKKVYLTSRESQIINVLLRNSFLSKKEISKEIDISHKNKLLDVHLSNLRKKIKKINLKIDLVEDKGYSLIIPE